MPAEASTLRCPSCGAPAAPADKACRYCGAALQAVRCPWCFQWSFDASSPCPRCGACAPPPAADERALTCPTCRRPGLSARVLGGARLCGCPGCAGIWADSESFKRICADRSIQAAYLGKGSPLPAPGAVEDPTSKPVVYRPCPVCGDLMNRFNFAGCSGVILDACKPHGVWFDADELGRIIAFIQSGGLDLERKQETERLEELQEQARRSQPPNAASQALYDSFVTGSPAPHISLAAELLEHIL